MRINFAHIRERSTSGGWIDFAVFEAKSVSGTDQANGEVLARLTAKAERAGYKIDQSALAFSQNGQIRFFGNTKLVEYLSHAGVPTWTHYIED